MTVPHVHHPPLSLPTASAGQYSMCFSPIFTNDKDFSSLQTVFQTELLLKIFPHFPCSWIQRCRKESQWPITALLLLKLKKESPNTGYGIFWLYRESTSKVRQQCSEEFKLSVLPDPSLCHVSVLLRNIHNLLDKNSFTVSYHYLHISQEYWLDSECGSQTHLRLFVDHIEV